MKNRFYLVVMCLPVLLNRTELGESKTGPGNLGHMVTIKLKEKKRKKKNLPQNGKRIIICIG